MKRQGAEGEFRSNLHRGGSAELVKLTKEERGNCGLTLPKVMGLKLLRCRFTALTQWPYGYGSKFISRP